MVQGAGGGGIEDFSVSPSLLGNNLVLELIGTWLGFGLGGFGTKTLGPGLNNITFFLFLV